MSLLTKDDAVRYPARTKDTLGIPAFLFGFLLTYLWAGSRLHSAFAAATVHYQGDSITFARYLTTQGLTVPTWKGAAWLFYNAHFVPLSGKHTLNLISATGGNLTLLYAIPPILLTVTGTIAASGRLRT